MDAQTWLAILAIAAAAAGTPGPNNALLASSGARFGFWPTLPHALGVALGFPVMVFLCALGLGEVFRAVPLIGEVLRWVGAALLFWLAWKTFNAPAPGTQTTEKPWSFLQAAAFQWVNPKAWIMAISVITQFVTGQNLILEALACASAFTVAGIVTAHSWAAFGAALRRFLSTPLRLRLFNAVMAALIVTTVIALMAEDLSL